jgi:high-affinity Fe2+/Pb2+ permease
VPLLTIAGALYAIFLAVMFVFVFIKIEVNLRDIRDEVAAVRHQGQPS